MISQLEKQSQEPFWQEREKIDLHLELELNLISYLRKQWSNLEQACQRMYPHR